MFWNSLLTVLIVVGGAIIFLQAVDRAEERAAQTLAQRLDCPRCGMRTLEYREEFWSEHVLYENAEESLSGFVLHCSQCDGEFRFTQSGELQST